MATNQDQDIISLEEFRQDRVRDDAARIAYEQQDTALHGLKILETAIRAFGIEPELVREQTTATAETPKHPEPTSSTVTQEVQAIVPEETFAPADTYAKVLSMEEKRAQLNPSQNTELNVADIQADVARAYVA